MKSSKIVLWTAGVAAAFTVAAILVFISAFSGWGYCANDTYESFPSPDMSQRALVFQRDCGATTGFSTQISILDDGASLPDEPGNTYIAAGHPRSAELDIEWGSNKGLVIRNASRKSLKAESRVGQVEVSYAFDDGT